MEKSEFREVQQTLGCPECHYADDAAIGVQPCCTFLRGPSPNEAGLCLHRKTEADVMREKSERMDKKRGHVLLPKEIADRLPALYAHEEKDGSAAKLPAEIEVVLKVFDPCGRGTWYATEFNPEGGTCFGFVQSPLGPDCDELGYWNLWEVGALQNRMGIPMERDCHWPRTMLDAVMSGKKR